MAFQIICIQSNYLIKTVQWIRSVPLCTSASAVRSAPQHELCSPSTLSGVLVPQLPLPLHNCYSVILRHRGTSIIVTWRVMRLFITLLLQYYLNALFRNLLLKSLQFYFLFYFIDYLFRGIDFFIVENLVCWFCCSVRVGGFINRKHLVLVGLLPVLLKYTVPFTTNYFVSIYTKDPLYFRQ